MRNIIVLGVAIITITAFAYAFMVDSPGTGQSQALPSKAEAISDQTIVHKLDTLAGAMQQYQQNYQDQLVQSRMEQTRLNEALTKLEDRIRSVENTRLRQNDELSVSSNAEQNTDTGLVNNVTGHSESDRMLETELGHWMDEILSAGYWDDVSTSLAAEQAATGTAKLPGVRLEDMQCSQRFCRASFTHETGGQPDIGDLFGEPPFVGEGFTVNEPDGTVTLYFTGAGVSLSELRSEALQAQR